MALDFSHLKPVKLDDSKTKELNEKLNNQVNRFRTPTSVDNKVAMWRIPVNDKALVYIPNFTREDENGLKQLVTEMAYIYSVHTKNSFAQIRETTGLTGLEDVGISGQDPLKTVEQENWEIYRYKIEKQAKKLGVDPKSDAMKEFRQKVLNEFSVRPSNQYIYFPIVWIKTEKDSKGKNSLRKFLKKDNLPVTEVFLYRISKTSYDSKFKAILDTLEEGDTLGGKFYNFSYDTNKPLTELKNPKRDSGLAFTVSLMNTKMDDSAASYLDSLAKELTPEFLRENVYELMLLPDKVHEEVSKDAHKEIESQLNLIKAAEVVGNEQTTQLDGQTEGESTAVDNVIKNLGGTPQDGKTPEENVAQELNFGN